MDGKPFHQWYVQWRITGWIGNLYNKDSTPYFNTLKGGVTFIIHNNEGVIIFFYITASQETLTHNYHIWVRTEQHLCNAESTPNLLNVAL